MGVIEHFQQSPYVSSEEQASMVCPQYCSELGQNMIYNHDWTSNACHCITVKEYENTSLPPGGDVSVPKVAKNSKECLKHCQSDKLCVAAAYNSIDKWCYLKDSTERLFPATTWVTIAKH